MTKWLAPANKAPKVHGPEGGGGRGFFGFRDRILCIYEVHGPGGSQALSGESLSPQADTGRLATFRLHSS